MVGFILTHKLIVRNLHRKIAKILVCKILYLFALSREIHFSTKLLNKYIEIFHGIRTITIDLKICNIFLAKCASIT